MNDRYLEALEQYEMEVTTVRKGRGAWICETDRGMRHIKGMVRGQRVQYPGWLRGSPGHRPSCHAPWAAAPHPV